MASLAVAPHAAHAEGGATDPGPWTRPEGGATRVAGCIRLATRESLRLAGDAISAVEGALSAIGGAISAAGGAISRESLRLDS